MFSCVSFHLGAFRYYTKLETKQVTLVQLMEKFVPRCLVTISRNERSRSAPLDPKLMFWCVCFRLGAYETFLLLHETRCEMVQPSAINAKDRPTKSRQNFSKRALLIHTIGP